MSLYSRYSVFKNSLIWSSEERRWRVLRMGTVVLLHSLKISLISKWKVKFNALRSAVLETNH